MKIDLFKLNNLEKLEIDKDFTVDESLFGTTGIRSIKNLHISGVMRIQYDEVMADLKITGTMVLGCAVTLEDVDYDFETEIDESLGNFEEIYNNNKNTFDIMPFIWGDIVSAIPIRVVKPGVQIETSGDGWELISND